MTDSPSRAVQRLDYTPPSFLIDTVQLGFELDEPVTTVHATLALRRNPQASRAEDLVLHGHKLVLVRLLLDGVELPAERVTIDEESLCVQGVPDSFALEITTHIRPGENKSLEGLYTSSGNFCTQCEPEGFRSITYFLDRPDVMARYTTTVVADRERYPVLLSNGNPTERGELADGRHWRTWQDPYPKPSYLFALVAGKLERRESGFTTRSGKVVPIHIYVQPQNADQCDHALEAVRKSMAWDEHAFGREYDLDLFMIVAVDDFNMGAMENKGLNIFNSKYVLARTDTATDDDFEGVVGVIGHEYFHNWSGDRVTCRDWFQLSLKEGFTVFRDQQFTRAMTSPVVKRIKDVNILRTVQFREDQGPLAHPVRPDSYVEINNFYTVTIYNKGAEVVRMLHCLLGEKDFRRATDLYFERHDGQAATVDDLLRCMAEISGRDLSQFEHWYSQAGTPTIDARGSYDAGRQVYTLTLQQSCTPTPGQPDKRPFHIPVAVGLLDPEGRELPLRLAGEAASAAATTRVLELTQASQSFEFVDLAATPLPSLLRDFSAPVRLRFEYTDAQLAFLMAHDSDDFNRWDAGQLLAERVLTRLVSDAKHGRELVLDPDFARAFAAVLENTNLDRRLVAQALVLPGEGYLAERLDDADPEAIHLAREFVRGELARSLRPTFEACLARNTTPGPYAADGESIGKRRLRNLCLSYLMVLDDSELRQRCVTQFETADNMTDVLSALACLADVSCPERTRALHAFYTKWQHEPLVVDKWLSIQATSHLPGTLDAVQALMHHKAFSLQNPNKVRALIGAFTQANPARFHEVTGRGYTLLGDLVLELDRFNPLVAARMLVPLTSWRRYEPGRRTLMRAQLERVLATEGLSKHSYEIASKSLADA
ncbi:MAG: aminopeptidase N [Pseudomonadota bacterium]